MTILLSGASDGLLLNTYTTFLVGNWAQKKNVKAFLCGYGRLQKGSNSVQMW